MWGKPQLLSCYNIAHVTNVSNESRLSYVINDGSYIDYVIFLMLFFPFIAILNFNHILSLFCLF
jgi:hypothetical protein